MRHKTFYGRNKFRSEVSKCLCVSHFYWFALTGYAINYEHKSFMIQAPAGELFTPFWPLWIKILEF
jgi:hypothetical protein